MINYCLLAYHTDNLQFNSTKSDSKIITWIFSEYTLKRHYKQFFSSIDSFPFEACFIEWVNSISDLSKGQIIAIDGKTIREAKSYGKKSPIHIVSAWACESNLFLGQIKTTEKQGVKEKRLKAGWDNQYLLKVLHLKVWVCPELSFRISRIKFFNPACCSVIFLIITYKKK